MRRRNLTFLILLPFAPLLLAERVPGRFIVELSSESVSEHVVRVARPAGPSGRERLTNAAAVAYRTRLRGEQQITRSRLEQRNAKVLDGIDTVANALFVEASDETAAQLRTLPGVKRVLPARRFRMVLDRAVILHKVVEAWNRIGDERAGAGVRIAIIDSGIEASHAGFQDSTLSAPDSFPRVNNQSDLAYTNGKIIVARSYVSLLAGRDPDWSARDRVGHGTALAMIAAGVRNAGPLATITGVAPKAYLGNYKVFGSPGYHDGTTEDVILKAIDDAVADGMDIINLSLGTDLAPRLSDDPSVEAVERAAKAGVIVVAAAGNNGPDFTTISSPATAPSAIAVGASANDRTFAALVEVAGLSSYIAIAGEGSGGSTPVTGPIGDVALLDGNGLACTPLTANSLLNRVALILRGSCTFETKLTNAQNAGAVAALVYAAKESPQPIAMGVGWSTLPAEMIRYDDGAAIKTAVASQKEPIATLRFELGAVAAVGNRLTEFSSAGPNVDGGIKPDLTAVGQDFYTATQTIDAWGDMYNAGGYIAVSGTSFSAPLVAGAAALLKGARPGLTVDQYRSLLINAASDAESQTGGKAGVQQAGAGLLDVFAALNSTVTSYPVALSLGSGGADPRLDRVITLTNLGSSTETFRIEADPSAGFAIPDAVEIGAGGSVDVPVSWSGSGLASGAYEGRIVVKGETSGNQIRIPFWYAATSGTAGRIAVLDRLSSGRRGRTYSDAILLRVMENSGVVVAGLNPQVTVVSGGGEVRGFASYDSEIPGLIGVAVALGAAPGDNVFRIQAGETSVDVTIAGR